MSYPALLADVDPKALLERYEQGEGIAAIAKTLDVCDVAVYRLLIQHEPELWKELTAATALAELDKAAQKQEEAQDMLSLSRARERVSLAKWRLERLMRKYFGQDQPLNAGQGIQINIGIGVRTVDGAVDKTLTVTNNEP